MFLLIKSFSVVLFDSFVIESLSYEILNTMHFYLSY